MSRYYVLRDGKVVEEQDHSSWLKWVETDYHWVSCIAQTTTAHARVSTHFLAIDLTLAKNEPPLLFETRVSGGWLDGHREKFVTLEDARAGHLACVDRVRAAEEENELPPPGAGW